MAEYLAEGERKALALDNRGPVRYDVRGSLSTDPPTPSGFVSKANEVDTMIEHWPWYLGGLALASVPILHWLVLDRSLAVSGRFLYSGSYDQQVKIWDTSSATSLLRPVDSVAHQGGRADPQRPTAMAVSALTEGVGIAWKVSSADDGCTEEK